MNQPTAAFFSSTPDSASRFPFGLGSDNHSGAHPRILRALNLVNEGFAASYGTDVVTEEAVRLFRSHFGPQTEAHFVFNGTAANVLAIAPFVRSHNAVICSTYAHIHVDECGAPEKLLGTKLVTIPSEVGDEGKITPEKIAPFLVRKGDQHFVQAKVVSITQPTELGTVYTRSEIANLVSFCAKHDLWLHVDGARFVNAAISLGCDLKDVAAGADSISFGGTKNGFVFGEAVLFVSDRARKAAAEFSFMRKQMMQLPSKTRFIAAQFVEFLGTDLWKEIATHAIDRASQLRRGLEELKARAGDKIEFTQATQANAIFVIFERTLEKRLKQAAFFYVWDEFTREVRLMTSWRTTEADIENVLSVARNHLAEANKS
ncbi:low specificity L-threonine aldolase [soil metagenome]